jgi:hypothetical protein
MANSNPGLQLTTCCVCALPAQVFCDIDLLVYASVWLPWPFAEVSRQQRTRCAVLVRQDTPVIIVTHPGGPPV